MSDTSNKPDLYKCPSCGDWFYLNDAKDLKPASASASAITQAAQITALRAAIEQHLTFDCFGGKADNLRKLLYETTPKTKDDPDAPPKG